METLRQVIDAEIQGKDPTEIAIRAPQQSWFLFVEYHRWWMAVEYNHF